jgi:hypothetical protein
VAERLPIAAETAKSTARRRTRLRLEGRFEGRFEDGSGADRPTWWATSDHAG